eukprot:TRINITY_DN35910_c1_g3_i3.p1 TRINITY_DN35910_c1_g3~~TRINITY_DN35910_c1_g3_i3.p1  ORF type:complete len:785 (+),score=104.62 TRINITY_DN35910_c1_g3_i3:155-2509(+)
MAAGITTDSESARVVRKRSEDRNDLMASTPSEVMGKKAEKPADTWGHCFVLKDGNPFRKLWDIISIVLLFYVCTFFLYRLAFKDLRISSLGTPPEVDSNKWAIIETVVLVLFWFDLFIGFFMSYHDRLGVEVISLRTCAMKYLRTYFAINLVACLPEFVVRRLIIWAIGGADEEGWENINQTTKALKLQRVSRLMRLARVSRVARLFTVLRKTRYWRLLMQYRGARGAQNVLHLVLAIHLLAVVWYLAAATNGRSMTDPVTGKVYDDYSHTWVGRREVRADVYLLELDAFDHYLHSFYFVLTVFSTVGFGDMSAVTTSEIACVILIIIVGAVVHSIVISEVIQIVTSTTVVDAYVQEQESLVARFACHTKLDDGCLSNIQTWIRHNGKHLYNDQYDREEMRKMLNDRLPRDLLGEIPSTLFRGQLISNRFLAPFKEAGRIPPRLPVILALTLHETIFTAGSIVYQMYDYPASIYFVFMGTFACIGRPQAEGGVDEVADQTEIVRDESETDLPKGGHSRASFMDHLSNFTAMHKKMSRMSQMPMPHLKWDTPELEHKVVHHYRNLFPYKTFSKDSFFGDVEVQANQPRVCTVRCETNEAWAFICSKGDFFNVSREFPEMQLSWRLTAKRRETLRLKCLKRLKNPQNCYQCAATAIARIIREKKRGAMAECRKSSFWLTMTHGASRRMKIKPSEEHGEAQAPRAEHLAEEVRDLKNTIEALRMEFREFQKAAIKQYSPQQCERPNTENGDLAAIEQHSPQQCERPNTENGDPALRSPGRSGYNQSL